MDKADELEALAERVEALTHDIGPFNPIREDIARAIGWRFVREGHPIGCVWYDPDGRARSLPDWPADLNAAMSLVPEGWQGDGLTWWSGEPSLCFLVESEPDCGRWTRFGWNRSVEAHAATPALALTAASLRALAAVARGK